MLKIHILRALSERIRITSESFTGEELARELLRGIGSRARTDCKRIAAIAIGMREQDAEDLFGHLDRRSAQWCSNTLETYCLIGRVDWSANKPSPPKESRRGLWDVLWVVFWLLLGLAFWWRA